MAPGAPHTKRSMSGPLVLTDHFQRGEWVWSRPHTIADLSAYGNPQVAGSTPTGRELGPQALRPGGRFPRHEMQPAR